MFARRWIFWPRFYECLLNARSAIFEKSWKFVQIFEYILFFKGRFKLKFLFLAAPGTIFFLDGALRTNTCNFGGLWHGHFLEPRIRKKYLEDGIGVKISFLFFVFSQKKKLKQIKLCQVHKMCVFREEDAQKNLG